MNSSNIFDAPPEDLSIENFETLMCAESLRIERIVSQGRCSPEGDWYDQAENEWVMVIEGKAILEFEDGSRCDLATGDYIHIAKHVKHKVIWTDPNQITIWLAVFY